MLRVGGEVGLAAVRRVVVAIAPAHWAEEEAAPAPADAGDPTCVAVAIARPAVPHVVSLGVHACAVADLEGIRADAAFSVAGGFAFADVEAGAAVRLAREVGLAAVGVQLVAVRGSLLAEEVANPVAAGGVGYVRLLGAIEETGAAMLWIVGGVDAEIPAAVQARLAFARAGDADGVFAASHTTRAAVLLVGLEVDAAPAAGVETLVTGVHAAPIGADLALLAGIAAAPTVRGVDGDADALPIAELAAFVTRRMAGATLAGPPFLAGIPASSAVVGFRVGVDTGAVAEDQAVRAGIHRAGALLVAAAAGREQNGE